MKRSILTFLLALVTLTAFAQSDAKRLLTGVVDDTEGEVLIGATVLDDGTNIGALTDADGKFSLSLPKDKTLKLIVKYVGFVTRTVSVAPNVS